MKSLLVCHHFRMPSPAETVALRLAFLIIFRRYLDCCHLEPAMRKTLSETVFNTDP